MKPTESSELWWELNILNQSFASTDRFLNTTLCFCPPKGQLSKKKGKLLHTQASLYFKNLAIRMTVILVVLPLI